MKDGDRAGSVRDTRLSRPAAVMPAPLAGSRSTPVLRTLLRPLSARLAHDPLLNSAQRKPRAPSRYEGS